MNRKGFTLIELLVVIGLLMVLMGTTIFGIEKISETTKLRNLKRIKLQIENATSVYFSENVIYEQQLLNKEENVICTRLYILIQKGLIDKNLSNPFNNEKIPANLCVYSKLNSNGVVEHHFDYLDEFINKYNNSNLIILEVVNGFSNENSKLLDKSMNEIYMPVTSNEEYDESRYVGYMYGGNTSLADNRTNTTDSTIKGVIDAWYQNNLLESYNKYISKSAIYCNDRSISSGIWVNNDRNTNFYYGTYERINANEKSNYKCGTNASSGLFESTQSTQDRFSASTTGGGNGELIYPIALMTADEVSFAGENYGKSLTPPYAWYYLSSAGISITETDSWWTMSPRGYNSGYSCAMPIVGSLWSGTIDNNVYVNTELTARPVVSINPCAKFFGTGTVTDPYVIDESVSCN